MTQFKIGDVVRLKTDGPDKLRMIVRDRDATDGQILCRSECSQRIIWASPYSFELIHRPDPQADIKQAIREVLLSDEFIEAFAKKAFGAKVEASLPTFATLQNVSTERSLEHPIPGVNQPMRNDHPLAAGLVGVRVPNVSAEAPKTANVPETPDSLNPSESPNSSIEPPKRYREPTQVDLANGPIKCEVLGAADLDWEQVVLVGICDSKYRFVAWSKTIKPNRLVQYPHCRIEATGDA